MNPTQAVRSILFLVLIGAGTACTQTAGPQVDAWPSGLKAQAPLWQNDVSAFEQRLATIAANARIPTEEDLVGDGRSGLGSEWVVLTDGAGGVVDLKPELGPGPHATNEVLRAQPVSWAFVLAQDEMNLGVATALIPDLGFDTTKSFAESSPDETPHLGMILLPVTTSRDEKPGSLKAGDRVIVEGTIGDASQNQGFFVPGFQGPITLYHLSEAGHPMFWVGLIDASIAHDEVTADD